MGSTLNYLTLSMEQLKQRLELVLMASSGPHV